MLKELNQVRNLKDPLKMFVSTWTISFDPSSPLAVLNLPGDAGFKWSDVELRCQTFGFPTLTGDKTTVQWGGFERRYAGKQTRAGDWQVTFTEIWNSSITEAFKIWLNQYHNYKAGRISLLKDYSATITINLLNPDVYDAASEAHSAKRYDITLYDVFPTSLSFPSINASSSDPIELTVDFSYNYFLMGNENSNGDGI